MSNVIFSIAIFNNGERKKKCQCTLKLTFIIFETHNMYMCLCLSYTSLYTHILIWWVRDLDTYPPKYLCAIKIFRLLDVDSIIIIIKIIIATRKHIYPLETIYYISQIHLTHKTHHSSNSNEKKYILYVVLENLCRVRKVYSILGFRLCKRAYVMFFFCIWIGMFKKDWGSRKKIRFFCALNNQK